MTPVTALAYMLASEAALQAAALTACGLRWCTVCGWQVAARFEVCPDSVSANGDFYGYRHRRNTCVSCRARRARLGRTPLELELGITIAIRPARGYRRIAA